MSFANFFSRLFLPLVAFLFIGVPLESYVRAFGGVFATNGDAIGLIKIHLFVEAAASFYCITILLECILVITRPHIRHQPNIPVQTIVIFSMILSSSSVLSYISIRSAVDSASLDQNSATFVLGLILLFSVIISIFCHFIDYTLSDASSPLPLATEPANVK